MTDAITERPTTYAIGDRVICDPAAGWGVGALGRVYVIERKGPKNYICRAEDGGRGLRSPAEMLLPAPAEGEAVPIGRPYVERPWIEEGTIVTLKKSWRDYDPATPLVCIKGGAEKINLSRLGVPEGGRYLRIPADAVVVRDLDWLTERLVEMA